MKTLSTDAMKVEQGDGLPEAVRCADGRYYRVLGVVYETTTCFMPVSVAGPTGARMRVVLGEQLVDPAKVVEERPIGPPVDSRGSGN